MTTVYRLLFFFFYPYLTLINISTDCHTCSRYWCRRRCISDYRNFGSLQILQCEFRHKSKKSTELRSPNATDFESFEGFKSSNDSVQTTIFACIGSVRTYLSAFFGSK